MFSLEPLPVYGGESAETSCHPEASFRATFSEVSWYRTWDPRADSLNSQGNSRCRSSHSVATQSMKMLQTRWAPPWGWSYISHGLKCKKGSVSYHGAEIILQGHFLAQQLAFTSSLAFLAVWKALAKMLCATGLGYGFKSQARGDVPNSTHVERGFLLSSFPHAVPHYPLH